jgi:hypothetical protein
MPHNQAPTDRDVREPGHRRQSVRINAVLEAGGKRCPIEITDYSHHGLSLNRVAGIEPDERVTVELRSGVRLPMRVVSVMGGKASLRFLSFIAPGHAVMRLLDQAARNYKLRHQAKPGQRLRSG